MNMIATWVKQITVFILIATIVELLMPTHKMKKYVHLVLGLILLLIFIQPLLSLSSIDIYRNMQHMERQFIGDVYILETSEQTIKKQKEEIQAEQDAYILSEVKKSLITYVKIPLQEQYNVEIIDIDFKDEAALLESYENFTNMNVTIRKISDENGERIDPIVIDLTEDDIRRQSEQREIAQAIEHLLSDMWEVDITQIQVVWEGGAN